MMKNIRMFVVGALLSALTLATPYAQDSIIRLTSDGWLVGAGNRVPLLLGSDGKGFLKVDVDGAITLVNSATLAAFAPAAATYITQTANAALTAEQALSTLSSGIMRVATTTGAITSLTASVGISDNISDETGSGVLVFATSPTLVTPILGVATATSLTATAARVTAPTDSTAVDAGTVTRLRSTSTITPASAGVGNCAAAFLAAALTADCVIATLPAGMKLTGVYAEVTAGFTCSGTCTGTKVVQCGTAAGGTEVLAAAFDVTAAGVAGDADAELGSGMTRAAAIQGGLIGSWSATTPISCRFTSGTGNWGDAAATFVNAGSIKFFLVTEQIK